MYNNYQTLFECNDNCPCDRRCPNRVAQNPLRRRLQVFRTRDKGWGLRTLDDIPKGGFICTYAGQILTDTGADIFGKEFGDEYLADLDFIEQMEKHKEGYDPRGHLESVGITRPDDPQRQLGVGHSDAASFILDQGRTQEAQSAALNENSQSQNASMISPSSDSSEDDNGFRMRFFGERGPYIMDAKTTGNVGRYLNHSCSPNVYTQNVFVDTQDMRFPWIAFVARKNIKAGDELCWDYNYEVDTVENKTIHCHCKAPDCRGRLL